MNNKKYFVILSVGAYSDYYPSYYYPSYYYGDKEITKEEFNKKGEEVGDKLMEEYLSLPERKDTSGLSWRENETERYNPKTKETIYPPRDIEFTKIMEKWLLEEMNYEKVDKDDCPEINIYYDIPTSKSK